MQDFREKDKSKVDEPTRLLQAEDDTTDSDELSCGRVDENTSPSDTSNTSHKRAPWWRTYPLFSIALSITIVMVGLYIYSSPRRAFPEGIEAALQSRQSADREIRLRLRLAFAQLMQDKTLIRPTLYQIAQCAFHKGDVNAAIKYMEESQDSSSDGQPPPGQNEFAMRALCDLYLRAGRDKDAISLLNRWRSRLIKDGNEISGSLCEFHRHAAWVYSSAHQSGAASREQEYTNWSSHVPDSIFINPDREPVDDGYPSSRLRKACWLFTKERYKEALEILRQIDIARLDSTLRHDVQVMAALTEYRLNAPSTFFEDEYNRRRSADYGQRLDNQLQPTEIDIAMSEACRDEAHRRHDAAAEAHFRHISVVERSRLSLTLASQDPAVD